MNARPNRQDDVPYIESQCKVAVRFQEVDVLGVVWHGHYLTYFEQGRIAFGREHTFDYLDIHAAGFIVPIVHLEVHFVAPAKYGDTLTIKSRFLIVDGAQLRFDYIIEGEDGQTLATGSSRQVFLDLAGKLIVMRPRVLDELLDRCRPLIQTP